MSKSKGGGTGRGTGKKGWNRWQAGAKRAASKPKPYVSKGLQKKAEEAKTARLAAKAEANNPGSS
ncbi:MULTISPECIES: DUF3934 family protein [Paenibacillus]|uniref:DUF3934 family protein n=1 Tax=Paenibacillus TaxID=44249 RepID=UPI00038F3041|nr:MULTISPECIES: DUF3934 family protein [Paenibacillus]ASS65477.1 DUF3934 domain-containing protein [Paenibacillus sp. RUD330]KKC46544.1 hypothetical protein VE23_04465 [Paenibacillus sp. D9]CDN43384.1 hypothetical protein BN871_CV_00460 [Paenibacillus sp. P22]SIQ34815.1 Protein of unknown function [Paenibacillus sp. RU4X]SIQ56653.1 Protein of unknown function [Paenibacillus sp. RU4T]